MYRCLSCQVNDVMRWYERILARTYHCFVWRYFEVASIYCSRRIYSNFINRTRRNKPPTVG